jgi:ribosome-associated protein
MTNHSSKNRKNQNTIVDDSDDVIISKTATKKAMLALQAMGEQLLALNNKQLTRLPLSDTLLDAITIAKKIKPGNGLRRQVQLIGKLMRNEDVDTIQQLLAQPIASTKTSDGNNSHYWCEKLIHDGEKYLSEFLAAYPEGDRQQLTQILRHIKKSPSDSKYQQRLMNVVALAIHQAE